MNYILKMKEEIKKIWKDPVWSNVISYSLITLIVCLINLFSGGWIVDILFLIWEYIITLLTFKISVYWIIIVIIVLISALWVITKIKNKSEPDWYKYTEDTFDDIKYRWCYLFNRVDDINPLCPNCDTPLISEYDQYRCPRCQHKTSPQQVKCQNDVEILIVDNVKKGNYKIK